MKRIIGFGCVFILILMAGNLAEANYDYSTGRWLQRDPLGVNPAGGKENPFRVSGQYKDGMNLYEAFRSAPLSNPDPSGLDCGIKKYKNPGNYFSAHRGLLVDGAVMDFGPEYPVIIFGKCPWGSGPSSDSEMWELKQRKLGLLLLGTLFPKPCSCATCDDIKKCLKKMCEIYDHGAYFYPTRNCEFFTLDAMVMCCLK